MANELNREELSKMVNMFIMMVQENGKGLFWKMKEKYILDQWNTSQF